MKTLQQIQDKYAKEQGFENWWYLMNDECLFPSEIDEHFDKILQIVQDELKISQTISLASIKLKIRSVQLCLEAHPDNEPDSEFEDRISDLLDCNNLLESILNTENIK